MEVRPAEIGDVQALGEGMKLVVDEGGLLATQPPGDADALAKRFSDALDEGHIILVLEAGDEVAGTLGLHPTPADGVLSLGMWVLREHRGRGGGRMLMDAALEAAAGWGAHKIELEVYPDNGPAIGLYVAMGFGVEGVRRSHYRGEDGTLRSSILMARLLERHASGSAAPTSE
jgi:ribosomal protein S18 acetylase RimI-like enzyme